MTDLDLTLLDRYHTGECTPAERELVDRWLAESPRRRALVAGLRRFAAEAPGSDSIDWRKDEAWAALERATGRPAAPASAPARVRPLPARWRPRPRVALRIAAAVALVAGGALAGRLAFRAAPRAPGFPAAGAHVVSAPRGQRLALRLADESVVMLAPGSTLRVPAGFGARDRTVMLEGEAAFTVTHDETRPFAVRTARAVARDLGTRFVVRAYGADEPTEVVVAEGKVAVIARTTPRAADSLELGPGERARVSPEGGLAFARGVALDQYFAWTEGRLLFRDTPLREVAARLGRWYDVEIRLASPELGERPVTASFRDEPAAEALRVVVAALELELTRAGDTYTLRSRRS